MSFLSAKKRRFLVLNCSARVARRVEPERVSPETHYNTWKEPESDARPVGLRLIAARLSGCWRCCRSRSLHALISFFRKKIISLSFMRRCCSSFIAVRGDVLSLRVAARFVSCQSLRDIYIPGRRPARSSSASPFSRKRKRFLRATFHQAAVEKKKRSRAASWCSSFLIVSFFLCLIWLLLDPNQLTRRVGTCGTAV